uniref:Uncharacterized protein n=1 Tax=Micrurus carvalhoi TaxID=3147026 RepID=A0A2H6N8J0_9SAUR
MCSTGVPKTRAAAHYGALSCLELGCRSGWESTCACPLVRAVGNVRLCTICMEPSPFPPFPTKLERLGNSRGQESPTSGLWPITDLELFGIGPQKCQVSDHSKLHPHLLKTIPSPYPHWFSKPETLMNSLLKDKKLKISPKRSSILDGNASMWFS